MHAWMIKYLPDIHTTYSAGVAPVFQGNSDIDQLVSIMKQLGTINEERWPGCGQLPDYNKLLFNEMPPQPWESKLPGIDADAKALLQCMLCYPPGVCWETTVCAHMHPSQPYVVPQKIQTSASTCTQPWSTRTSQKTRLRLSAQCIKLCWRRWLVAQGWSITKHCTCKKPRAHKPALFINFNNMRTITTLCYVRVCRWLLGTPEMNHC